MALPRTASLPPQPYRDTMIPGVHGGIVTIPAAGSINIDLGIGHNDFYVASIVTKGVTRLADGPAYAWDYGTRKGTIVLTAYKRPGSYGAWVIETNACTVSFEAREHRA